MSVKDGKDGAIITIYVKPNAPKFSIQLNDDEIIVHSTKEPVKGKVNAEILKEFTKLLHVKVELIAGATSRQKQLLVKGLSKSQTEQILQS